MAEYNHIHLINPTQVIRHLRDPIYFGIGGVVYSDKIVGGRSIKVEGWEKHHYDQAVKVLLKEGFFARVVLVKNHIGLNKQYRIHVKLMELP